MRLSTKGRYAVTAMLDLAIHHGEGAMTLAGISEAQGISLSYLEQLFARLRKNGLVEGIRGPGGGYQLSRPPNEISVAHVIDAIGEGVDVGQATLAFLAVRLAAAQGHVDALADCVYHVCNRNLVRRAR